MHFSLSFSWKMRMVWASEWPVISFALSVAGVRFSWAGSLLSSPSLGLLLLRCCQNKMFLQKFYKCQSKLAKLVDKLLVDPMQITNSLHLLLYLRIEHSESVPLRLQLNIEPFRFLFLKVVSVLNSWINLPKASLIGNLVLLLDFGNEVL